MYKLASRVATIKRAHTIYRLGSVSHRISCALYGLMQRDLKSIAVVERLLMCNCCVGFDSLGKEVGNLLVGLLQDFDEIGREWRVLYTLKINFIPSTKAKH